MLGRRITQLLTSKVSAAAKSTSVRCFASQPSLDQEFPGMPELSPASARPKPDSQVTVLPNGLTVASEENYEQITSLGMFIEAGSSYETDANTGVSHLLEHMAFKSTQNRSHLRLVRDVEDIGGSVGAASAREYMVYTGECLRDNVESMVDIMSDSILRPKLAPWDIEEQRKVIGYELEEMETNAQAVLTEILHAAAYGDGSSLGRPLWCPKYNLENITDVELKAYMDTHFVTNKMVLSGAGIGHSELVDLATKYFGDLKSSDAAPAEKPKSSYVGGDRRIRGDSHFTHVALCFDAGGWNTDNLLEICALHMLLGGGGSFSAGGPGKGMYSRLYTNVLNRLGWVDSATAFNSMYNDAGLLGIYGTCLPQDAGNLVDVMAAELIQVSETAPGEEETQRAKNQLKSSVLMNLESRNVLFEDIGRQLLTYGKIKSPVELCAAVDAITAEDMQKAAAKALQSPVTVAAFGDVSTIPSYDVIASRFQK